MDMSAHRFTELFAQLGLPADEPAIRRFIATHSPLAAGIELADATFWTAGQASFLREEIVRDADWAEVVDQLNSALRAPPSQRG
ncbi:MAG: DUF2789 domain-containing protein [Burkholderiaceae bacterium]|jgi:hypothetical protein